MRASKAYSQLCHRLRRDSEFVLLASTVLGVSLMLLKDDDDDQKQQFATRQQFSSLDPSDYRLAPQLPVPLFPHNHVVRCDPHPAFRFSRLRRHHTMQKMEDTATKATLKSKYDVQWKNPLGQGTFGTVYIAKSKTTGEQVAVKKIMKRVTSNVGFQREMDALLHLKQAGGHPNIAQLQEIFEEKDHYYLVLDLVLGGEMFDALCSLGAYSEADAARLVREVACALAFLHGIGIVHGDLKPENLMLSSESTADAVIKVVDFGTAQVSTEDSPYHTSVSEDTGVVNTPAYAPPEALDQKKTKLLDPSFDMWALGVIIYIMLTGVHPFDLHGSATDDEIRHAVLSGKKPPLRKSPLTAHLSADAVSVIEQLIQWNPNRRLTADQLLENAWVRGEKARTIKMADSDKRLSAFRAFKTKISEKVFKDMLSWTAKSDVSDVAKRTSLLERAFNDLDPGELQKMARNGSEASGAVEHLSLSDFSDLLADNMKNRYFPKGHVVYHEGDIGNEMYFINSGSVQVYTRDGFEKTLRTPGEFFGEGALLHPNRIRSASIRCLTPVHAIEISREYFEKYVAADKDMDLDLRAKSTLRTRQRAKSMLQLQKNMQEREYPRGSYLFRIGEEGKELFILEDGVVDVSVQNHTVFTVEAGSMFGEHSLLFGKPRNVDAKCVSKTCKTHVLRALDFYRLMEEHPTFRQSIREVCLRREFQKSLCVLKKIPFPRNEKELKKAFESVASKSTGELDIENLRQMLRVLDPTFSESDIHDLLDSLDLDHSGTVKWEEFKRLFDMNNPQD